MTITELKEKIRGFEEALSINKVNPFNKIFAEGMKDSLIDLQAELITQLDELIDSVIDDDGLVNELIPLYPVVTAGSGVSPVELPLERGGYGGSHERRFS